MRLSFSPWKTMSEQIFTFQPKKDPKTKQMDMPSIFSMALTEWASKWKWNAIAVENHSATECLMLEWTFSPTPLTEQHNYSTWPGLSPDKFWIYRLHNISGKPVLVLVTKDDKNSKGWKYCCLWVMPDFCTRKKTKKNPIHEPDILRELELLWYQINHIVHLFSKYSI